MATSDLATTLTQCLLLSVIIHASNIEGSRERRQVSEDGWGPWEDKNECSRSCGGGVTYQERHCYENREDGSPMCVGPKRIYSSCNTEDCPAGTKDFRLEQCERYNNISFEDKIYEWVPYYGGENKCELNCLAKGEKFYYRHAAKVVDGTRCSHGALDVCVDGVCQVVGCDKMLGSTIRLDKCHKCGGDGTSCKTRQGELFTDKLKTGYNDVLLIPAGATTINVQEVRASNNYLALRDLHGNYLLNGNWKIDLAQPKDVAGTTFEYERKAHPSLGPESISAPGPIDQPIFIVVLHQPGDSSPVTYEYSIPQDVQEGGKESYSWVTGTWESCSKTCGRGIQVRSVRCESVSDGEMVPFDLCDPESKPQLEQECNDRPCAASWHSGEWAECSTTCGEGVQVRTVFCQRLQHGSVYVIVEEEECTGYRPTAVQTCNHHVKCPKWEVGDWSSCNRVCGPGEEVRSVICRAQHALPNAISDILPEWRCHPEDKPISRQQCNEGPCEGLEWVASRWSGCTMSCDVTVETRHIVCSSKSGKFFPDEMCDMDKKPIHKRQCPLVEGCQGLPQWHASQWSKCSAECGSGIEVRQIICARVQDLAFVKLEDELCDPAAKMPDTRNCTGEECGGLWFTGPWGKCTLPCGGGQRKREVMCFSGNKLVTVAQCDSNTKPDPYEDCNLDPCDEDNLLVIGGCKGTSHGCCPDGITPADGPSYEGCPLKDRIVPGACLETLFGCCLDGITPAQGPFNFGCPDFTCKDTAYGCCKDGQTPSGGHNYEGCPVLFGCEATAYGCCLDGLTPANGLNHDGCGETPLTKSCHDTTYGCCPDGVSPSNGINYDGCEIETSGEICEETLFGCCADGVQAASGPDGQGCNVIPLHCSGTLYGCCPDQVTAAEGPEYQGCVGVVVRPEGTGCSFTVYGCCPDGIMAALGPNGEGCQRIVEVDCATTTFGCCNDRETIALGPNFEGCSTGCEYTDHGCCPDGKTAAIGPNYEGCDDQIVIIGCESTQFGCCPDKVTPADGPNFAGCNITRFEPQCDTTSHGCCPDGQTVAAGANFEGCAEEGSYRFTCRDSPYGCCPDDETQAQGPNNAGCPSLLETGGSCGLASETGPCSNYSVKWFFDPTVGECTRFWYGGCDGNDNRFESREECQGRCMKPEGLLKCYLPRSVGRCRASAEKFYYNSATRQCETFVYGGCQGNDNKFDSAEECEDECVIPQRPDVCAQPHMPGPCRGSFQRWFYDKGAGQCRQFIYGGCKGNDNRFEDREQCDQRCLQPPTAVCQLPADVGPCRGNFVNWYYNPQAKQCEEFVYGGCHGNANRFPTQQDCQSMCKELITPEKTDYCRMPMDPGPCRSVMSRWYFDKRDGYCKRFTYGGCQGNGNRFETELTCRTHCQANPPDDVCTHAVEAGPCDKYVERFFFDKTDKQCKPFVYGGCQGNSNNFGTMEECSKACHHGDRRPEPESPTSTENRCNMAKDSGPCLAYMPRWYYNLDNQRCEQFIYGGCQGNKNRFMSQEDCRDACTAEVEPEEETRPSEPERPTEREDHRAKCSLPEAPGQCEAYIPSWYYNSVTESCQQFVYGGCDGNDNRFETEADCDKACSKEDICLLSKSPGECKGYFPMWYYHKDNARCEQFIYGGCNGNANRFDNREECEGRCGTRHEPREPYPQPTRRPEPTYRPEPHEPTEEPITGLSACALMSEPGPCRGSLSKWYYDTEEGKCKEFVYGGCRGNENRFDSQYECESTCQVREICSLSYETGPCRAAKRRYFYDSLSGECRQFTYGGCQGNPNRFLSVKSCEKVCQSSVPAQPHYPGHTDICSLPMDGGPCTAYIPSWHYDATDQTCKEFVYGGCVGNDNRFSSRQECQQRCRGEVPTEEPRHVYTEAVTGDVCSLTKDPGPCNGYNPVWYFEPVTRTCRRFLYGGCGGNGNRFDSREDCRGTCLERTVTPRPMSPIDDHHSSEEEENVEEVEEENKEQEETEIVEFDVCSEPADPGPCDDDLVKYFFDSVSGECRMFKYGGCDGNANRYDTEEHCRHICVDRFKQDQCEMPQDKGPCKASILRWYYEATENVCKDFLYGGCRGNDNNFVSKQKCQVVCQKPYDEDTCSLPQDVGPCKALKPHWFFDTASGECALFNYGGCQGNSNRFKTQEECAARCGENRKEKETEESQPEDICKLPRETGPCFADIQKFYYDSVTGECRPFMYGGCQGNKNNFDTQEECYSSCESSFEGEHVIRKPGDCFKPRDKGPCDENEARWYFDTARGDCSPFYYGGCAGNGNNFHSYDDCLAMCSKVTVTCGVLQCDLKCPYGFDRNPTDGCPTCSCYEPCLTIECAENEVCEMEHIACLQEPCPAPTPICVLTKTVKVLVSYPGVCPGVDGESVDRKVDCLVPQCHQDGHCPDGQKCCYNGCVRTCMPFLAQPYEPPVNPSDTSGETEDVIQERQKAEIAKEIEEIGNEIIIIEKEKNKDEMYEKTKEEESKEAEKGDIEVRKESREDIDIKDFIRKKQSEFEAKIKEEIEKEEGKLEDKVKDLIEEEERQLEDKIIEESEKVAVDVDNETKEVVERTDIDTEDKVKDVHEKEESEAKMKVEKAGKCPHVDANLAGICVDQCTQDNDCRGLQKCCSNGCGHTCVQPSQPAAPSGEKPGYCPAELEEDLATICIDLCTADSECPDEGKCCSNGCGHVCVPALTDPPTTTTPAAGCANTVFGCCPDGVTPAGGYNFRGCPEEKPLIEETGSLEVSSPLGGTVRLPCRAHGAPAPQITWYKEDFPIMNMNEDARLSQLEDGTLQIEGVTKQDAISYTCRAYNGIGEDTRTYTINVLTAVSFKITPSVESVLSGQQARLICRADGNPKPSIKWYRNEQAVTEESGKYTLNVDGSLHIEGTTAEDEGDYICEADNGLDAPARKTFNILILEPLTVMITKNNESFVEKSDVQFMCVTQGGGDITTRWTKDKKPLPENPNIRETDGELLIENVEKSDAGSYECTATRGREEAVAVTVLKVEAGSSLPSDCMDKPWLANCVLIIEAQLCSHRYFSNFCCKSCYEAGYL